MTTDPEIYRKEVAQSDAAQAVGCGTADSVGIHSKDSSQSGADGCISGFSVAERAVIYLRLMMDDFTSSSDYRFD